jgi:cytochrome P450
MATSITGPDQLLDPDFQATGDPYAVWRWMRGNAPVHRHPPSRLPAFWSITRYADVRAIYSDPATFSSARGVLLRPEDYGEDPGGGLTLALTDPPRHKQLRSLVAGRFNVRHARTLEEVMRADIRQLLRRAADEGHCDFAHDIGARLPIYLICRLLGIPEEDHDRLFQWTNEAFEAGKPLTAHMMIMQYFIDLMYERMEHPTGDVASLQANGTIAGRLLTETEILLNFENLVGATENAGLSMSAGMQAFLEHPEQWRRLREDRGLLATAVEEVLRWTSSAAHSMRTATRPYDLHGHPIAAGELVVVWLPSANRDESAFPDPDRFDIARRPNRHLALGFGEHVCIGGVMARTQLRILLSELLQLGHEFEPAGPPTPLRSLAVRGPAHLPVRITAT